MRSKTPSLKTTMLLAVAALAFHLSLPASHASAQAACITNLFSGLTFGCNAREMKLVRLQKNNKYASYMVDYFELTSSAGTAARANGGMLYSDRFNGKQMFDISHGDEYNVTITKSNGNVTLNNVNFGTSVTLPTVCSNNMITAQDSGAMWLITYGGLVSVPC